MNKYLLAEYVLKFPLFPAMIVPVTILEIGSLPLTSGDSQSGCTTEHDVRCSAADLKIALYSVRMRARPSHDRVWLSCNTHDRFGTFHRVADHALSPQGDPDEHGVVKDLYLLWPLVSLTRMTWQ
jgi:hypothetical protein